jgi:hypothetical protein
MEIQKAYLGIDNGVSGAWAVIGRVVPQTNDDMSFEDAWNEVSKSYMIGQLRHARPIAEKLYAVLKGEQDA